MEKSRVLEIGRFVLVGGISFLIDWGLLFICTEWLHIYYLYSSAISFTVSVLVNYFLCVVYVFSNSRKQTGKQAILFIGSSIVGLGLNQICMKIFVEYFFIYYMLAKIFSTGIVMIWNYWMMLESG